MSGGVDSSVTALLLHRAGYDVIGVTFSLLDGVRDDVGRPLSNARDIQDARQVADALGIEHQVVDFASEFERDVVERFCRGYERGDTPNPCIDCNRFVKFEALRQHSRRLGCDFFATGHYARPVVDKKTGHRLLLRGKDANKDQSYVLYRLTQNDLARLLLPIGELAKDEVRRLADEAGLANAHKRESQDICFVPDGDYAAFVERRCGHALEPGRIVDADGNVLGEHTGLARYTIGQRKGLGIAAGEPLYVLDKLPAENTVVVGPRHMLMTREVRAHNVNFIAGGPPDAPDERFRVSAKTSYRQEARPAWAQYEDSADGGDAGGGDLHVTFDGPIVKPAPGQSIVLYDGDAVLGGGILI